MVGTLIEIVSQKAFAFFVIYACALLIWKENFNLISETDLFMYFYIVFQISFEILQDKKYRNVFGVRSEL